MDPKTGLPVNVVASIDVGPFYHSRIASAVSQWYVFNDFSVNTISPAEAVWFNLAWKQPCIFFYAAGDADMPECLSSLAFSNPITASVFGGDLSLAASSTHRGQKRITFSPLAQSEMPRKGDLVAIDAEFVTLNQEESELRSDGKVSTIKAAQM